MKNYFDIVVVGAGIIGAATAWRLSLKYPNKSIAIVEKESSSAQHQTGRNSGVIHAGVYYQPGSLKAQFCRQGLDETIHFCQQYNIDYRQCGKLIVATSTLEEKRLSALFDNCVTNDLSPKWIDKQRLKIMEPNIKGVSAVHVTHSGITDYAAITNKLLALAQQNGAITRFSSAVSNIEESSEKVSLRLKETEEYTIECDFMINCAGVYADQLIKKQGLACDFSILPFRGEYFRLHQRCNQLTQRLIYPVPDPELPFLGVHLTPMIGGYLTVGPNAVLAFGKQAYTKSSIDVAELYDILRFSGSWRLMRKHLASGYKEFVDSVSQRGYLKRVHKYCESIQLSDLLPYRAGIRAQAVSQTGELLHDFKFVTSPRTLHVGNAPSPAATSAIPIADSIVAQI